MGSKPTGISASRGAAILGLSKWSTPVEAWLKIMEDREPGFCEANGYERPVSETNMVLEMGLAFEESVIRLAQSAQEMAIVYRERAYKHSKLEYITCHIDGQYTREYVGERQLHEGKTTSIFYYRENFGEPGTDRVPQEYQIQCQHQMLCTGIDECILSVLVFPFRQTEIEEIPSDPLKWAATLDEMGCFHQYFLKADPELQKLMLKKYHRFWERHVLTGKPPRPRTYRDIRRLVKAPQGTIVANAQIERWAQEYRDLGDEMKWAKNRKDELKTKILEFMRTRADVPIDDESQERWILKSRKGRKLASFNGKTFR
jgi:predicted phage-related endonuclease